VVQMRLTSEAAAVTNAERYTQLSRRRRWNGAGQAHVVTDTDAEPSTSVLMLSDSTPKRSSSEMDGAVTSASAKSGAYHAAEQTHCEHHSIISCPLLKVVRTPETTWHVRIFDATSSRMQRSIQAACNSCSSDEVCFFLHLIRTTRRGDRD
jgi:hypothetical protein